MSGLLIAGCAANFLKLAFAELSLSKLMRLINQLMLILQRFKFFCCTDESGNNPWLHCRVASILYDRVFSMRHCF